MRERERETVCDDILFVFWFCEGLIGGDKALGSLLGTSAFASLLQDKLVGLLMGLGDSPLFLGQLLSHKFICFYVDTN